MLSIILVVPTVLLQMYWAYSVWALVMEESKRVQPKKITPPKIILFAGSVGYSIMCLTIILGSFGAPKIIESAMGAMLMLGMTVGNLSVFALIGIAAFALEKYEKGKGANALTIIGSFLAIFYFPIGIWFLHPRVKKIGVA